MTANGKIDVELAPEQLRRVPIVKRCFEQIANDVFVQQFYGLRYGATYLTNSAGEAQFLSSLHEEELALARAQACEKLSHYIPLMDEVSLDSLIRLRKEEPDAFVRYRNALDAVLRDCITARQEFGEHEARELYLDVLKPEVDNLEVQAKTGWRSAMKVARRRAVATGAIVAIGLYSKYIPANTAEVFKALGLSLLAGLGEQVWTALEKDPDEVRKNQWYFLLRLHQAARN